MNTSHYPTLELCKKLAKIGFPETDKIYSRSVWRYLTWPEAWQWFPFSIKRRPRQWDIITCDCKEEYLCPSVMEMLDVIPEFIDEYKRSPSFSMWTYWCRYRSYAPEDPEVQWKQIDFYEDTLPNALANMILWLHENKFISFNQ